MKTLSPYAMTWAVIIPAKGKFTKKDINTLYRGGLLNVTGSYRTNEIFAHFGTLDAAKTKVLKNWDLSKPYRVVFITDKQFGLCKYGESLISVATKKQLRETNIIY